MTTDPIVIVAAKRTPQGQLNGMLASKTAPQLASIAIQSMLQNIALSPEHIDAALLGCVLSAGIGQAPARQAILGTGLPQSIACTTLNRMCGSGLETVLWAHSAISSGFHKIVLTGGMESMSQAPYLVPKARSGYRLGHGQLYDSLFLDGLEDAYEKGTLMGVFADRTAEALHISRETQDTFAIASTERAQKAIAAGKFKKEIAPVLIKSRKSETLCDTDEAPGRARPEKIPTLKPAFSKDGTVTAANASSISDGAATLLLMQNATAIEHGLTPLAKIAGTSVHSQAPEHFTTAPVGAMQTLLKQTGWSVSDVDLFEINEAFAVVTLAAMQALDIPHEKVNVYGGACALGHPIGASGARILVTLLHALQQEDKHKGVATLCIGGGEAAAIAIERL